MANRISTVIFDLGEVQISGFKGIEVRLEPLLGVARTDINLGLKGAELTAFFNGQISENEYLTRIMRKNGWDLDIDIFKALIRENFREIEGTRDVVEELRVAGYNLGILSVHGREWMEYIFEHFDFHRAFGTQSYSYEAGVSKPDVEAYTLHLAKQGSRAEECIFIDDIPKNLVPAESIGMGTILFTNAAQLRSDLAALGIS